MTRTLLAGLFVLALPFPAAARDREPLPPARAKAALLKLLDRPRVPADVRVEKPNQTRDGRLYEWFSLATEAKPDGTVERMPVLVVRPHEHRTEQSPPRPAVVVLHGTGGSKEGVLSWLDEFADKGFVAVGIDARYHGDRVPGVKGSAAYVAAITRAWRTPAGQPQEHPFYYDTVWDLWRLLDHLETRPEVDKTRIGMVGISMGGIQTWLAASADDRVAVACPLIAVQSFRWSLENDRWQGRANTIRAAHEQAAKDLGEPVVNAKVCRALWDKVIPGMLDDFDCPNLLPLFAGRALFIANGDRDPNCPVEGARLAIRAAEEAFARTGSKEKLEVHVAPGVAHKVTDEQRTACVALCVKWLAPK